jgi:hypothetical protein
MPRFDGTGPMGQGPRTGRGMGPCGGGMGFGCMRGNGAGLGRRFYTRKEESEILKDEAGVLEEELKAIKERLEEIGGEK